MKSSTRQRRGKMHQIKGKLKEAAGIIVGNRDLEAEGEEKFEGQVQENFRPDQEVSGQVEGFFFRNRDCSGQ